MKNPPAVLPRSFLLGFLLILTALPLHAALISLSASGTISLNSSIDPSIPIGTPWTFELIYDTAAADMDFELTGAPDPTFGRFTNSSTIPALTFFHYQAGTYEVTIPQPSDFGPFSAIVISFGGTHAIDINLNASSLFPPLGGGPVSFHANFDDFSHSTLTSDALPTDISLGLDDFQSDGAVTLLPPSGVVLGSRASMTDFRIAVVPEPSTCALFGLGFSALLGYPRRRVAGRYSAPTSPPRRKA